jgi:transposase
MQRRTREQLEQLEKSELIDLIFALMDEMDVLKAEVAKLRAEVDELKRPVPPPPAGATSKNSSLPPSRDYKSNRDNDKTPKKRGARDGHSLMQRVWVDNPDAVIECAFERCRCGADVSALMPNDMIRRQITELPQIKPVVIETHQPVGKCPCCGKRVYGMLPEGLEAERAFGPRLEATVTYFQHQQHMSYERTQNALHDLFDLRLSQGGIACVNERAGEAAGEQAQTIQQAVQASPVIKSDETSARVDGHNWWEWVFVGTDAVLHLIRPSRGEDVIVEAMGQARAQAWVSDCWGPQLRAPADNRQLCLAHQIRNLQGLIECTTRLRWAHELPALFREAIHLVKRRDAMSLHGFKRRVTQVEHTLARLIDRPVTSLAAQALVKRYRKHRNHLLVFLHDPTVPYHNNDAERALRGSVVHRKVIGGFRSAWGAHAYAAIASVVDTAKLRVTPIFDALLGLFGKPVLHFVSPMCRE